MKPDFFSPYSELAVQLLPGDQVGGDGAHDLSHIIRVFKNAMRIHAIEGGDGRILSAATFLHDCVAVEKNSPLREKASALAAEQATVILASLGWTEPDIKAVAHAILTHSFSANIPPETIEAKILQDADRLDSIGIVGASRCFYTGGRMNSALYDPFDPLAKARDLDDKRYCLDHFETKLLKLSQGFQTETGGRMAKERDKRLRDFLSAFLDEI